MSLSNLVEISLFHIMLTFLELFCLAYLIKKRKLEWWAYLSFPCFSSSLLFFLFTFLNSRFCIMFNFVVACDGKQCFRNNFWLMYKVARETNEELRAIQADPAEAFDVGAILSIARRCNFFFFTREIG